MSEDLIEDTSQLSDDDEEPITAQKVGDLFIYRISRQLFKQS